MIEIKDNLDRILCIDFKLKMNQLNLLRQKIKK